MLISENFMFFRGSGSSRNEVPLDFVYPLERYEQDGGPGLVPLQKKTTIVSFDRTA
jgi:hypothetical protein